MNLLCQPSELVAASVRRTRNAWSWNRLEPGRSKIIAMHVRRGDKFTDIHIATRMGKEELAPKDVEVPFEAYVTAALEIATLHFHPDEAHFARYRES